MTPRWAKGKGKTPRFVSYFGGPGGDAPVEINIDENTGWRGWLGFGSTITVSKAEFRAKVEELIAQKVCFSVGGMGVGAADELGMLMDSDGWPKSFLQISWKGPGDWQVHEIVPGAKEWKKVSLSELLGP